MTSTDMIKYTSDVQIVGQLSDTSEPVFQAHVYADYPLNHIVWKGCRRLDYGDALQEARLKIAEYQREEAEEADEPTEEEMNRRQGVAD